MYTTFSTVFLPSLFIHLTSLWLLLSSWVSDRAMSGELFVFNGTVLSYPSFLLILVPQHIIAIIWWRGFTWSPAFYFPTPGNFWTEPLAYTFLWYQLQNEPQKHIPNSLHLEMWILVFFFRQSCLICWVFCISSFYLTGSFCFHSDICKLLLL